MAGNIKGITIEFRGDDSNLSSAINRIRNEAKTLDKELNYINKDLKFNPTSVALWSQKQKVLTEEVKKSKDRVKELEDIQKQLDAKGIDRNSAEYRELEREIEKAKNKQKQFEKELRQVGNVKLKALSEQFKSVGNNLVQAGQALSGLSKAAAGVDVALGALAVKSGMAADELNTMSKVTGISVENLQKYKAAADLVDVSVETIANSQKKMKQSMYSAQQGSGAAAEAYKTLGVAVVDANGDLRSQDEVFTEAIQALGQMENETERDALAMKIFGKSASDLNPLIEDNGETYKRVADIFNKNELSLVDQETIDKANEFQDTIDEIKITGQAALSSIGMQLAGYLQPALEKIAGAIEKVFTWLSQLDPEVLTIIGIIAGVVAGLAPVIIVVGNLAFAISNILSLMSTIGPAIAGLAGPIGIAIAAIGALIAIGVAIYKNWDTIKAKAKELKDWVVQKWTELKTKVEGLVIQLKTKVLMLWDNIKTGITNAVTTAITWCTTKFNNLKTKITNIFNGIKTVATSVWEGIKLAITHPIEAALLVIRTIVDKIKGLFNKLHINIPHIKLPHFSIQPPGWKIGDLLQGKIPKLGINWYKTGGIFKSPSVIGVGEAGTEAVIPIEKLKEMFQPGGITININAPSGMDVNALAAEVERRLITAQKRRTNAWA